MAVTVMAARRSDSSEYGWFVREMMMKHRISSQQGLADAAKAAGHPISQPALSKVLGGKTEPSRRLHRALAVAMDLTPEEGRQFNDIFALADLDVVLTDENREGMQEIDEEARRAAEDKSGNRAGRRGDDK